jgi:DNA-binding CsgD family transcriptional regulator
MEEVERASKLIGDIYDAALDRALWPSVLESTCGYVHGFSAMLGVDDSIERDVHFFCEWGTDPQALKSYSELYGRLNPMSIPTMLYAKVGSVYATSDLVPYDELIASRFFKEWVAPQGVVDAISVTLDKSARSYAALVVQRHACQGRVDDDMRRRLSLLAPHFRRAVAIGKVIELHKVEAASLADTLDGLATAMVLVASSGRIVHANAAAHAMLARASVIRIAGDKLAAIDGQAERALLDIFANAGAGDAAVGIKGIDVPLAATDGERYVAHVLPLTSGARKKTGVAYSAVAAVFVRKAAFESPHPIETIANTFKLTPAEMRVLMTIVDIGGVPEVAPILGISETTVKTHLQHVFAKTGASRQADLVKLIAGYMSPLAGPRR